MPHPNYRGVYALSKGAVDAMLKICRAEPGNDSHDLIAALEERSAALDFQARQTLLFEPELTLEHTR